MSGPFTKISIVIPTYNGQKYIAETLNNILASTFSDFEILCIDDKSQDFTTSIIKKYQEKDKRIRLIELSDKSGNPSKSISLAVNLCKGEYLFYMSQDDLVSPDLFEKMLMVAEKNNANIVVPNMSFYSEKSKKPGASVNPLKRFGSDSIYGKQAFIETYCGNLHSFALKKTDLVKEYPYDDKYFDSTDVCTMNQYYFSKYVYFSDGVFYYRKDNPKALTAGLEPVKTLDSRLDLLKFAISEKFSKSEFITMLFVFMKTYKNFYKKSYRNDVPQSYKNYLSQKMRELKNFLKKNGMFISYIYVCNKDFYLHLKNLVYIRKD